ncbi:MAG: hypothetical protein PHU23_03465 [Dehalococcoidales bacterium]|nr:hypothetical protein [Dehalococcoidales bacterium]
MNALYNHVKNRVISFRSDVPYNSQSVVHYFSYMTQLYSLQSSMQMLAAKKFDGDISLYRAELEEVEAQVEKLKPIVEQTIARQISEVLAEQGIYNPFGDNWFKLMFPPVNFKLEEPMYVLIISPRDHIERIHDTAMRQGIVTAEMEQIESSLAKLNVSALVVQIGGLGATYPSVVINNADLRFTIDVAVEEWLHQYLAFKPLGFRYILDLLHIAPSTAIPVINETVAGTAAHEIGAMVYDLFYSRYKTADDEKKSDPIRSGFDFNAAMRETRQMVDYYLAQGQIDEAEQYMERQRQFLVSQGYYIRKLNQAYFAFHGSYAHHPSSVDPVGEQIRLLRDNSLNVKDFLDSAAKIRSQEDLDAMVEKLAENSP